jgi:hypothetical protein
MSDQPNAHDSALEELQRKVEDLRRQVEAREKIERSQLAASKTPAAPETPAETGDQEALKKLVADKMYDAPTQARGVIERQAPATTETGMDRRAEAGPELKEREFWPDRRSPEG